MWRPHVFLYHQCSQTTSFLTRQNIFSTSPIRHNLSRPHVVPVNSSLDPTSSKNESYYLQLELVPVSILASRMSLKHVSVHTVILFFLSRRLPILFQHPCYLWSVCEYQLLLPFVIRKFWTTPKRQKTKKEQRSRIPNKLWTECS